MKTHNGKLGSTDVVSFAATEGQASFAMLATERRGRQHACTLKMLLVAGRWTAAFTSKIGSGLHVARIGLARQHPDPSLGICVYALLVQALDSVPLRARGLGEELGESSGFECSGQGTLILPQHQGAAGLLSPAQVEDRSELAAASFLVQQLHADHRLAPADQAAVSGAAGL